MKRILGAVLALSLIFILSACNAVRGNGNVSTEEHDVRNFNHISVSGIGEVYVTVGEEQSVTVETDENLHQYIEVEVRNNTLHIGLENGVNFIDVTELIYTITVPELQGLDLSGAGSVEIEGVDGESFAINASGATEITLTDVDVDELHVEISGAGNATVSGRADELRVDISGAGDFNGFDLDSENAHVEISGVGSASVTVSDELSGQISGAGNITYRGNPDVDVDTSGAGHVSSD